MKKLDGKALLAQAEAEGQLYRIKSGWKKLFYFCAFLMMLLIITFPLGIWFIFIARSARLGMNDEGFAIKWFGTRAVAWEDIAEFQAMGLNLHASGGGLVGGLAAAAASAAITAKTKELKGPLGYKLTGKKHFIQMPAHAIENSWEMARQMEKHTQLTILPPEEPPAEG